MGATRLDVNENWDVPAELQSAQFSFTPVDRPKATVEVTRQTGEIIRFLTTRQNPVRRWSITAVLNKGPAMLDVEDI